jgi:serine/threonine protein kinase/tetratricopeptide (TPR) repeat protein
MPSREREIFEAALEQPADARAAFVSNACEGDRELEDRIRRLIAADAGAPQTLDWKLTPPNVPPPDAIGPYRILKEVGQGGMGTVYLAEQTQPMRRYVALKLIRQGMNTEEVVARFENERQAMALMNHPNVARILDGGATVDGWPYFVMEYVDGLPITEFCDRRRMRVSERVSLFVRACHAVRHAHENGVLHRDLKPTNVLVAEVQGQPFPKVIDFGIAKAIGEDFGHRTVQTMHGALIGTPAFMSPEQLDAVQELDARSDVYSLGVILYELVAGIMPVELPGEAGIAMIVRLLQDHEPVPPSVGLRRPEDGGGRVAESRTTSHRELRRLLRGDIDAIVMKSLERLPADRYGSVREMTDDLERFEAGEPVRARRATAWYRTTRFVRRHRLAAGASVLVFLSLVMGLVMTSWQARVARTERDRATAALGQAQNVSDFLIGLFEPSSTPQMTETDQEIIRRGVDQAHQLSARPVAQAQMLHALGLAYRNLIDFPTAHELLARAYELRDSLFPEGHPDAARTLVALGVNYASRLRRDSAFLFLERALDMGRKQFGGEGRFTAEVLLALGRLALADAQLERAEAVLLESVEVLRRSAPRGDPGHAAPKIALGDLMRRRSNFEAATRYYLEAIDHLTAAYGPEHAEVAGALFPYGDLILEDLRDARRAIPIFEQGLRISEDAYGPDDPRILWGINSLAFALADIGELDSAETLVRRGVGINQTMYGDHHMSTAREREQLANVLVLGGKYAEAEQVYRDVARVKGLILGDATTWSTMMGLSRALVGLGRFQEAESAALEAWRLRVSAFGEDSPVLSETALAIGEVYRRWGRYDSAETWSSRALELAKRRGDGHPLVAQAYEALARTYEANGETEKAALFRRMASQD